VAQPVVGAEGVGVKGQATWHPYVAQPVVGALVLQVQPSLQQSFLQGEPSGHWHGDVAAQHGT
jgi:hypothetical protein